MGVGNLSGRGLGAWSRSGAQVQDDVGEQLGRQHQVLDPNPLVRAVEVGVKAGQGAAEGHAAGNAMYVGAPAGGQTLSLQPGVLLIPPQQGLDEGGVRRGVVGAAGAANRT